MPINEIVFRVYGFQHKLQMFKNNNNRSVGKGQKSKYRSSWSQYLLSPLMKAALGSVDSGVSYRCLKKNNDHSVGKG